MRLKATYKKHISNFIIPGGTSRGVLMHKDSYIVELHNIAAPNVVGIGEVSVIDSLSIDAVSNLEQIVAFVCVNFEVIEQNGFALLERFPAVKFGFEAALIDLKNGGNQNYYPSNFTRELDFITINGLIWMGNIDYMISQIDDKIKQGFSCLKLKIGSNEFHSELTLLSEIRKTYSASQLEIRLDANGAFSVDSALDKLDSLSQYAIHSIEQPVKQGDWAFMKAICLNSPIDIALDEELIGITNTIGQKELLETIHPKYIIIKPSLLGGFSASEGWINLALANGIKYWITSALETNIGLNAIAQWSYDKKLDLPQGLGTGKLFSNNFDSPLYLVGDKLFHKQNIING